MKSSILLRYHEIALKGDNRSRFEQQLARNARQLIQRTTDPSTPVGMRRTHGRVILETDWNPEVEDALSRVFGLSSFSPMRKVKTDLTSLVQAALEEFEKHRAKYGQVKSFKVKTRRSDKALPETSPQIDRIVGGGIAKAYPEYQVDLKSPEMTLGIEIRNRESFIWTEKISGPGGLPVGANAHLLSLISGGIDSPVAAIHALRRGTSCSFVHFYGAPYVGPEVFDKVLRLVKRVNDFQPNPKPLYVIPFGKIQEKIALVTPPRARTLLYRRMMFRISNELAKQIHAQALVTGESIGQVASQTVENLSAIHAVSGLPVVQPLVTFDKDEIISKAQKWGTYETSLLPGLDCCTLFADRHPVLKSRAESLEELETQYSVSDLIQEALVGMEVHHF